MKLRIAAAVSAAMLVLIPTAGCRSDPIPPVERAPKVDLSNPDEVIANALQTMFTWKPTRDASPDDAYHRAAIYLSGDLAKADNTPEPRPGSQWEQWRAGGATIDAQAYLVADETPPNTDDQMHRVVVIIQSALSADRRLIDEIRHTAWVTADNSKDGWHVTSIEF